MAASIKVAAPAECGAAGPGRLAQAYRDSLLASLGLTPPLLAPAVTKDCIFERDAARDWARSGLMWLTGLPGSPPQRGCHAVPSCAEGALAALADLWRTGPGDYPTAAQLLTERAALLGMERRASTSPNGSCHLFSVRDGILALNLARADDWRLIPAWLEQSLNADTPAQLASAIRSRKLRSLVDRGRWLGLALAPVEMSPLSSKPCPWYRVHTLGLPSSGHDESRRPIVVDLSALWAGPLCSHLLQCSGARVIRVESTRRPDGARLGSTAFFDLLNAGKESVALDFSSRAGVMQLRGLLAAADIVIEGSRPRALQQLGIDADALVRERAGLVWIAISGYGRSAPQSDWIAFGDDAACAAGLFQPAATSNDVATPCGDALCDPLTGVHAALAASAFWRAGQGALLDISLSAVGDHCRQFYRCSESGAARRDGEGEPWYVHSMQQRFPVCAPSARMVRNSAAPLGTHTTAVLQEFVD